MEPGLRYRASICIDRSHPALPGHFPGRPVVPGVLVLERVVCAAEACLGRPLAVVGLPQVKFAAALGPDEPAECLLELRATRLSFELRREGQTIARGVFALGETEASAGAGP